MFDSMKNTTKHPLFLTMFSPLHLSFFFHLIISITAANNSSFIPPDIILLDCGSSSNTTAIDGRNWTSDPGQDNTSTNDTAKAQGSTPLVPYMTARIFRSQFTYSFPVSSGGPKFIRLYFYSASYSDLNISKAFFSVTVGRYTLLRNFSASLTADHLGLPYFTREFSVNTEDNQRLDVTFAPSPNTSDSFAFMNGIEIVSMPSNLYNRGVDLRFLIAQQISVFSIHNETTTMETVYRLNVGGNVISPKYDSGMFRTWENDQLYVVSSYKGVEPPNWNTTINYSEEVPAYTAPKGVYSTSRTMSLKTTFNINNNLTWYLPVDSGFNYLVRLHFCEYQLEITKPFQTAFFIFINNLTAESAADVISWSGGNGVPVYKDYVVNVPEGSGDKQGLWIALHPVPESNTLYSSAILNGLEIFKLSSDEGNLAGHNPPQKVGPSPPELSSPLSDNPMKNPTARIRP